MKFTISRKTWLRGEGCVPSYLLRSEDKKMCCLGFLSLACGLAAVKIEDVQDLRVLDEPDMAKLSTGFLILDDAGKAQHSDLCWRIMRCNDTTTLCDLEREKQLTELFAEAGIEVEFRDGLVSLPMEPTPAWHPTPRMNGAALSDKAW